MDTPTRHDFRIDAWKPDTLPMARLAKYLVKLAVIYGYEEHVHFVRIRKGSAVAETLIDYEATPKVLARLRSVGGPSAPPEAYMAYQTINQMLREDNASAVLRIKKGAEIIRFPGRKTPLAEEIVMHEHGELDGTVIRVGGKDDSVPVWLQSEDGEIYKCWTKRSKARDLALLFDQSVRVAGQGKWRRTADRIWELESFEIQSWEVLEEAPLSDVLGTLRAIEGSGWNAMDAPQEYLRNLREA